MSDRDDRRMTAGAEELKVGRIRFEHLQGIAVREGSGKAVGETARRDLSMFDRFTDHAKSVLNKARQHSQRLNHEYLGTEHMLLGLLEVDGCRARAMLESLAISPARLRSEIDSRVQQDRPSKALSSPVHAQSEEGLEYSESAGFPDSDISVQSTFCSAWPGRPRASPARLSRPAVLQTMRAPREGSSDPEIAEAAHATLPGRMTTGRTRGACGPWKRARRRSRCSGRSSWPRKW
jgi:hypothetical protein